MPTRKSRMTAPTIATSILGKLKPVTPGWPKTLVIRKPPMMAPTMPTTILARAPIWAFLPMTMLAIHPASAPNMIQTSQFISTSVLISDWLTILAWADGVCLYFFQPWGLLKVTPPTNRYAEFPRVCWYLSIITHRVKSKEPLWEWLHVWAAEWACRIFPSDHEYYPCHAASFRARAVARDYRYYSGGNAYRSSWFSLNRRRWPHGIPVHDWAGVSDVQRGPWSGY